MIVRSPRKENFTTVKNALIEDSSLNWDARGLLVYLLSKPDHWKINKQHLVDQSPAGDTVVRRVIKELEVAGYLIRQRIRNADGTFTWNQFVYDEPQSTTGGKPTYGSSTDGSTVDGKPIDVVSTEVVNTDKGNTEDNNNYAQIEIEPQTVQPELELQSPDCPSEASVVDFKHFWGAYPRKQGKNEAEASYVKAIQKIDSFFLFEQLERQVEYWKLEKREKRHMPYAATWLNKKRWEDDFEDEIKPAQPQLKGNAQLGENHFGFKYNTNEELMLQLGATVIRGEGIIETRR